VPYRPGTDLRADPTQPTTWGPHKNAAADVRAGRASGVGYVFTAYDNYFGIDLDGCRNPITGALEPWAQAIVDRFATYTEPSPSGTGVHLIGEGTKPGDACRSGGQIECYDDRRYFTMTGLGTGAIRDCQNELTAWYHEVWPPQTHQAATTPPVLTLDDQKITDHLTREQGGKAARLLAGEMGNYPSPSEARGALTMRCCFYSDDADQIARIVASSKLFADGTNDRERKRKSTLDATTAVANYTGPRYNPEYRSDPTATITGAWNGTRPSEDDHAAAETAEIPDAGLSRDELLVQLRTATATIARERERRVAAEARADALSYERSRVMQILRAPDLSAGQKLTAFGTVLDLGARIANGEEPTPAGYKLPAIIVAEKTGQTAETVQRHLRSLDKLGIVRKTTIREESTPREHVDQGTGEILTVRGMRDITYINVPDGDVGKVIDAALAFRRPEDAPKHGGARTRPCPEHPTADIVRTWQDVCGECGVVLNEGQSTRRPDRPECKLEPEDAVAVATSPPDLSGSSLLPEPSVAFPVYRGSKLEPEESAKPSGAKREPERFAPPPDHRPAPPGVPGFDPYTDPGWRSA
jgi:DNA-binding transcriptional ArsR family regulator